ncbi:transcription repressor OFP14-like [Durio zibethinus]|uniref:Transcription repressor n=1 Tax=Durio zibethinus TaxID=66656 RepID=A0A6P6BJ78_DURZI|nr:transcription repressor OFP14-like [Durio zibethinus]
MSKKLQKSLQDYLSKIKKPSPNTQFPSNPISSSKKWILKSCKHPKTLSFVFNRDRNDHGHHETSNDNNDYAATLSDVDRFLFENFKSLYIKDGEEINERRGNVSSEDHEDDCNHQAKSPGGILFESPRFVDPPPDLCGSNRFFVATGLSSSLIEEARSSVVTNTTMSMSEDMGSTSTSTSTNNTTANDSNSYGGHGDHVKSPSIHNECIAVIKCSPSPYDDFKRSMQDMVEARLKHHLTVDWDFMEELLFCYLNLNDKKSYKYVLSAFVDLIVDLRQNDRKIPARSGNSKVNARDERSRRTRHNVT